MPSQRSTTTSIRQCWEKRRSKRSVMQFGKQIPICEQLPPSGLLFRNIAAMPDKRRSAESRRRCRTLKIDGIALHSYRYAGLTGPKLLRCRNGLRSKPSDMEARVRRQSSSCRARRFSYACKAGVLSAIKHLQRVATPSCLPALVHTLVHTFRECIPDRRVRTTEELSPYSTPVISSFPSSPH